MNTRLCRMCKTEIVVAPRATCDKCRSKERMEWFIYSCGEMYSDDIRYHGFEAHPRDSDIEFIKDNWRIDTTANTFKKVFEKHLKDTNFWEEALSREIG